MSVAGPHLDLLAPTQPRCMSRLAAIASLAVQHAGKRVQRPVYSRDGQDCTDARGELQAGALPALLKRDTQETSNEWTGRASGRRPVLALGVRLTPITMIPANARSVRAQTTLTSQCPN